MELGLCTHYQPCFLIWRCKGMLPILREMSKLQDIAPVITNAVRPGNHDAKVSETICSHFLGMQIPLRSAARPYQPFVQLLTRGRVFPRLLNTPPHSCRCWRVCPIPLPKQLQMRTHVLF